MTTEQKTTGQETATLAQPEPQAALAPEVKEEEQTDWKAKAEQAEALARKLQNDLRSQQKARLAQNERDTLLTTLADKVDASDKKTEALIKALAKGDTESLPEEFNRIDSQVRQSTATKAYEAQVLSIGESVKNACYDDDGNQILDPATAPELEDLRQEWHQAVQRRENPVELAQFVARAYRIATKVERQKEAETRKQQQETRREGQRQARERGDLDQTLPTSGAAGAPPRLADIDPTKMTPKQMKEALEKVQLQR